MTNHPLNAIDKSKLMLFALALSPSLIIILGIPPILILIFGLHQAKKSKDFGCIEVAVHRFKVFMWCCFIPGVLLTIFLFWDKHNPFTNPDFLSAFIGTLAAGLYLFMVGGFFLKPLREHKEWLEKNGLFNFGLDQISDTNGVDIINNDGLQAYSTADELLKWAELKERGLVTDKEYFEARKKLLGSD